MFWLSATLILVRNVALKILLTEQCVPIVHGYYYYSHALLKFYKRRTCACIWIINPVLCHLKSAVPILHN